MIRQMGPFEGRYAEYYGGGAWDRCAMALWFKCTSYFNSRHSLNPRAPRARPGAGAARPAAARPGRAPWPRARRASRSAPAGRAAAASLWRHCALNRHALVAIRQAAPHHGAYWLCHLPRIDLACIQADHTAVPRDHCDQHRSMLSISCTLSPVVRLRRCPTRVCATGLQQQRRITCKSVPRNPRPSGMLPRARRSRR
jgi:hypothetical protein